jgi:hypothetical protein
VVGSKDLGEACNGCRVLDTAFFQVVCEAALRFQVQRGKNPEYTMLVHQR